MIKHLSSQLPENRKLKIGGSGPKRQSNNKDWYPPVKWKHIKICLTKRGADHNFIVDEELTQQLGSEPIDKYPTVIGPVLFLFNTPDLNLQTMYRAYVGKTCVCSGDGELADRIVGACDGNVKLENLDASLKEKVECPCDRLEKKTCKPNGMLTFVLPSDAIGSVCKFRTTSWNSIRALLGSMELILRMTGGALRGIPLYLRLNEKLTPVKGQTNQQWIRFLSVEFKGGFDLLRTKALEATTQESHQLQLVEDVEVKAQKRRARTTEMEYDEEAEEYYPTKEVLDDGTVVDKETGAAVDIPEEEPKTPTFGITQPAAEPEATGPAAAGPEISQEEAEELGGVL